MLFDEWWATLTFCSAFVFILYYGIAAPWYKTPFGRALIAIDLGLALATFPTAYDFVLGGAIYENRTLQWITLILAPIVPLAIMYRIVTMWMVRNRPFWKGIHPKDEAKHEEP